MDWNQKSLLMKHQIFFHGSMARRVLLRSFLIASAFSVIPLIVILTGPYLKMLAPIGSGGCSVHLSRNFQGRHLNPIWSSVEPTRCRELANSTEAIVKDLVSRNLVNPSGAKALCLGQASAFAAKTLKEAFGFSFSEARRRSFRNVENDSFDFVLSLDSDEALVTEIERVLVPGGIGAIISESSTSVFSPATLKNSRIVFERVALVAFKKNESFLGEEELDLSPELFPGEPKEEEAKEKKKKKYWFRKFEVRLRSDEDIIVPRVAG